VVEQGAHGVLDRTQGPAFNIVPFYEKKRKNN
jgi:hypothetical protein